MGAKVINKSEVKKSMKIPGIPGSLLAAMTMKIAGLDKLNELYDRLADYKGVEFADKVLEYLDISLNVNTPALENIPKEGGVVITSNHPFGGLDGLAALSILGKVRKDVKILTNFILSKVPNVSEYFIIFCSLFSFFARFLRASPSALLYTSISSSDTFSFLSSSALNAFSSTSSMPVLKKR